MLTSFIYQIAGIVVFTGALVLSSYAAVKADYVRKKGTVPDTNHDNDSTTIFWSLIILAAVSGIMVIFGVASFFF